MVTLYDLEPVVYPSRSEARRWCLCLDWSSELVTSHVVPLIYDLRMACTCTQRSLTATTLPRENQLFQTLRICGCGFVSEFWGGGAGRLVQFRAPFVTVTVVVQGS